jgi:hypothetical protein
MGFRTGFVLSSLSFLAGVLFICAQYDHPLIFHAWSDAAPVRAERFYLGLYAAPRAVHALLHGMIALGIVGLLAKLHRWTETAKWFDGAALGECTAGWPGKAFCCRPMARRHGEKARSRLQRGGQQSTAERGASHLMPAGADP